MSVSYALLKAYTGSLLGYQSTSEAQLDLVQLVDAEYAEKAEQEAS